MRVGSRAIGANKKREYLFLLLLHAGQTRLDQTECHGERYRAHCAIDGTYTVASRCDWPCASSP